MLKYSLPALAIALLGAPLAEAQQHYGLNGPVVTHYRPAPARTGQPTRLARANDGDSLDDLDALESLDALSAPANGNPGSAFDGPGLLSLDQPSPADLPAPRTETIPTPQAAPTPAPRPAAVAPRPAPPVAAPAAPQANYGQNYAAPQGNYGQNYAVLQSVLQPNEYQPPATSYQPAPQQFDLGQAMTQQDYHNTSAQYFDAGQSGGSYGCSSGQCGSGQCSSGQCGAALMPYRKPILPQGYSFHGYFRADPCYYDIWSGYGNEAAAACAEGRAALQPKPKRMAQPCVKAELVEPCRR